MSNLPRGEVNFGTYAPAGARIFPVDPHDPHGEQEVAYVATRNLYKRGTIVFAADSNPVAIAWTNPAGKRMFTPWPAVAWLTEDPL